MAKYGLTTWYDGAKAEIDIIFIHGLRGGRESTWTKHGVTWPKELLPEDIPASRILSFGYDSQITHLDTARVTQGSLADDARQLCCLLDDLRAGTYTCDRPIITVGHSLGGLVLAQVIHAGDRAAEGDSVSSIARRIKGMIFLGTPFYGSKIAAWGDVVRRIIDVSWQTDRNTLKNLEIDGQHLRELRLGFPEVVRKRNATASANVMVVFFFERKKTYKVWVVNEGEASYPGVGEILPMQANHHDICKFDDAEDDGYKQIRAKIKQAMQANEPPGEAKGNSYVINNSGKITNLSQGDMRIDTQTIYM